MTDMQKFLDSLSDQQKPVKEGDWGEIIIDINLAGDKKSILVTIESDSVGFAFDAKTQQFQYIFNWKE